jgi:hypothetical protein
MKPVSELFKSRSSGFDDFDFKISTPTTVTEIRHHGYVLSHRAISFSSSYLFGVLSAHFARVLWGRVGFTPLSLPTLLPSSPHLYILILTSSTAPAATGAKKQKKKARYSVLFVSRIPKT